MLIRKSWPFYSSFDLFPKILDLFGIPSSQNKNETEICKRIGDFRIIQYFMISSIFQIQSNKL